MSVWVPGGESAVLDGLPGSYLMGAGVKWQDHMTAQRGVELEPLSQNASFLPA